MKTKFFLLFIPVACLLMYATACTKDDPKIIPDEYEIPEYPPLDKDVDVLPVPLAAEVYSPSLNAKQYYPIMVGYSSAYPTVTNWTTVKTRILPYLMGFTADTTAARYKSITNKYGSRTDRPRQAAKGRFYTKKIDGRWWIIDPEGCIHYERSVASFRKGTSARNVAAWNIRFGSDAKWLSTSQSELAEIGFHGTGAFCTNAYNLIQDHNKANPSAPMTLAPSFGFLSQFRSQYGLANPGGDAANAAGLAFHTAWGTFCENYIRTALAAYLNDPNVLGIFSDNEIDFSSGNSMILSRFRAITDVNDPARKAADDFMASKGATTVTSALNDEFAGIVAAKYYKGVKEALMKVDPGMMYLGTRLHGTPKYLKGVIEAAGKYCDIISINYYSRWSAELTTYVKNWGDWADAPFLVTEFYTKAQDSDLNNQSGAGFLVPTQKDRAYAYQHFTLGLLEAKNCVGWHWFKYQDDDGSDNDGKPANKGMYDNQYKLYPHLSKYARAINYNAYDLIEFFDK